VITTVHYNNTIVYNLIRETATGPGQDEEGLFAAASGSVSGRQTTVNIKIDCNEN